MRHEYPPQEVRFLSKRMPPLVVRHVALNAVEVAMEGYEVCAESPHGGHYLSAPQLLLCASDSWRTVFREPEPREACCCRRLQGSCPGCRHLWEQHEGIAGCRYEVADGVLCHCPQEREVMPYA
jgi:hypothetical protein